MSEHVTTRISTGTLRGVRADGIDRYLGIPYAAAPIGDLRFREPQPAPAWDGVRDATTTGPTAPQNPYGPVTAQFLANVISPGDGYLNLNIWAPVGAAGRPVMVWVHGGSFAHGSNALDGYDGSAFARDGVVLVSINYRLGTEGFSVLPGVPANLGLTDIAAALRWVRAEIAAFGGDPHNVTAFGESAGASAVGDLLGSPHAVELFDKAILQSGTPSAVHPERAGRITRRTAKRLGIPATRDAFAAEPSSRLLAAEAALTANSSPVSAGLGFQAAISEPLLPREPLQAILDGAGDSIPVMLGWNAEETRLWLVPSGLQDRIGRLLFTAVRLRFRIGRRILRAYRAAFPAAGRGQLLGEFATDFILRLPYHRIGDHRLARRAPLRVRLAHPRRRPRRRTRPRDRLRLRPADLPRLDQVRRRRGAPVPGRRHARRLGPLRDDRRPRLARLGLEPPRDGLRQPVLPGRRQPTRGDPVRMAATRRKHVSSKGTVKREWCNS